MLKVQVKPSRWAYVKASWPSLSFAQKLYTISMFLALLNLFTAFQFVSLLAPLGILAIAALIFDIWNVFEQLWYKLAGKAFLVSIYLVLANYCYALAQSQVNALVGIHPDLIPHSVNVYLFLLAPLWCFTLACVVLILYTGVHAIKGLLLLFLRPFGVYSHHLLNEDHPVLFLFIRVLLLPVTVTFLSIAISGYMVAGEIGSTEINFLGENQGKTLLFKSKVGEPEAAEFNESVIKKAETLELNKKLNVDLFSGDVENSIYGQSSTELLWVDRVVAKFLYKVESMSRSQCQLSGVEHLVPINDYEVLIIRPAPDEASGFKFFTRPCNSSNFPRVQIVAPRESLQ